MGAREGSPLGVRGKVKHVAFLCAFQGRNALSRLSLRGIFVQMKFCSSDRCGSSKSLISAIQTIASLFLILLLQAPIAVLALEPANPGANPLEPSIRSESTNASNGTSTVAPKPPTAPAANSVLSPPSASHPGVSPQAIAPPVRQKGPPQPKEYLLPNGLRIVLVEEHSLPVVSCLMWYRVGARNERAGSTGLSHMVEHMLFEEVGPFRKGEIGATIVRNGGQFNGFTSDDFTAFFETLHPSKLDLALRIESMRMRSARFTKQAVQAEVANINKEFEEEQSDPAALLTSEVRCVSYLHHPYGSPTRGWRVDVDGLTAEDAKGFYDRFYVPNNASLVLVGDFSSANALLLIKKHFAAIPKSATPIPQIRAHEPEQHAERRVIMRYPGKTELLQVAYHAPSISDQDSAAMAVLEKLMNANFTGRLKTRLMETKICSGASSQFELKHDPGLLTLNATPAPGQSLQKVLESVDGMISQLRTQVISDQELRRAKNQAEFACFSERDGPYRTGFHLGYFDSIQSWKSAYSWPERLRLVTAADILRVSRKYLVPENRVVGFLASSLAQKTPPVQNAAPVAPKQTPPKPPQSATNSDLAKQKLVAYKGDDSAISPEEMRSAGNSNQILIAQAKTSKDSAKATAKTDVKSDVKPAVKPAVKPDTKVTTAAPKSTDKSAPKKVETSPTAKKSDGSPVVKKADPSAIKTDATKSGSPTPGKAESSNTAVKKDLAPKATAATRSPRPPVGSSLQSGQYTRKVLKNGLTVIAFESRLSPIVQICGAVRAGEVYEPTEKPGLSAVVAHSLNYGTPRATKIQLQTVQEDMGLPPSAMLKFEPGLEQITFQTRCLAKDLVQQLGIVAESLASPALAEADLEKAKQDAINGLKKSDETVAARVNRALMRSLLAPNSPHYPTDPSEKAKVIEALKNSEIKDFYTANISPGSTLMVIAGDIDGEQAIRAAEAVFESWQSNARTATEPGVVQSARRSLKVSVPIKDRTQTMICIGKLIKTAPGDRDFHNLAIADCALTNHPIFSRLVQRDNDEAVMATSMSSEEINSRFQSLGGLTSWSLIVPTEPDAVSKAVTTVNTELKNFVKNGLTLNEIQEVKRYLAGVVSVRYMPNLSVAAKSVMDAALERSEGDFVGELLLKIANADPETINRFIRNVFRPDQSTLVVAGDKQAIRQVQPRSDSEMRAPASDSVAPPNGAEKSSSAN